MKSITIDFINTLRNAQKQLYQEISINKVESVEVKRQADHFIKLYNKSRINLKEYFALINQFLNQTKNASSIFKLSSDNDPNNISFSPIQAKKITSLISYSMNYTAENQKQEKDNKEFFRDMITFSIIPSYYNFFLSEYSIKSLFKLFSFLRNKNNDEYYDSMARVGFITPFFLNFSRLCFQPIFSELLSLNSNTKAINKTDLIQKIQYKIKEYQNFIPDETLVVLACSSNPLRTLVNSFFAVALSTPILSQVFCFFHFTCKKFENILSFLKSIFCIQNCDTNVKKIMEAITSDTKSMNDQMNPSRYKVIINKYSNIFNDVNDFNENADEIQELNDFQYSQDDSNDYLDSIIKENENGQADSNMESENLDRFHLSQSQELQKINPIQNKYHLLSLSDIFHTKEILQTKLLSSIDIEFIKITSGTQNFFKKPSKIEYFVDSKTDYNKYSQYNTAESTILSQAYLISPMIRHLLQRADPIPIFKKVPEDMSIANFLYIFLVKHGDRPYLAEREIQYDQIMNLVSTFNLNQKTIEDSLSFIRFKRKKSIRVLSTFTPIEIKIIRLNQTIESPVSNLYTLCEANHKIFLQLSSTKKPAEIVKVPSLITSEFELLKQRLSEFPESKLMKFKDKIIYAILFDKIDLETYSILRGKMKKLPHTLSEYDKIFFEKAKFKFVDFLSSSFLLNISKSSQKKFNIWRYLEQKITSIQVSRKEIVEIFIDAFNEVSMVRKIEQITTAMELFQSYLLSDLPPNEEMGTDQLLPSTAALILQISPPMAITNLAYLHDMTNNQDIDLPGIFRGPISTFSNYLYVAVQQIFPEFIDQPPFIL